MKEKRFLLCFQSFAIFWNDAWRSTSTSAPLATNCWTTRSSISQPSCAPSCLTSKWPRGRTAKPDPTPSCRPLSFSMFSYVPKTLSAFLRSSFTVYHGHRLDHSNDSLFCFIWCHVVRIYLFPFICAIIKFRNLGLTVTIQLGAIFFGLSELVATSKVPFNVICQNSTTFFEYGRNEKKRPTSPPATLHCSRIDLSSMAVSQRNASEMLPCTHLPVFHGIIFILLQWFRTRSSKFSESFLFRRACQRNSERNFEVEAKKNLVYTWY